MLDMFKLKVILVSLLCIPLLLICAKLIVKLVDEALKNSK